MFSSFHSLDAFNEGAAKGKQMIVSGTKSKAASQGGYFERSFTRILEVSTYNTRKKMSHYAPVVR